ncbi:MAG: ABC transporter permease [Xanthobacteraceae bacterium]
MSAALTTRQKLIKYSRPWLVAAALILLWEGACRVFHIPEFVLPAPSRVIAATIEFKDVLAMDALQTLMTTLIGFAIAIVVGVLLGIAIGSSSGVYDSLYPLLIGFNSIPKVAVVPLIVIWSGIGTVPAIITAFVISFFPIVVNVAAGLASVEPEMKDVLRVLGASRYEVLTKVGIPRSLPYLFASLKVAITLAFIGSVVSETIASNDGIGYLMLSASSRYQVALIFSGVIVIAAMSILMFLVCVAAERRLVGWAFRGQLS